jgi:AcrR family transcriptional regulator
MAKKQVKFELAAVDRTKAAFNSVTKGLKGVGSTAASVTKGVAGVGLAATATAGAIALLVNKSFEFIDAIGKTATRTGITTSAIQAFHLAARESGTNIEGANKALEKFARSVGDAQRGLKTMKDIFKALGVELETTDGHFKSTDELLEEVAIGISGLGSQTQKATALANLFGRQGILLTNALEDLATRGMDGFIDRAESLGLILSTKVIRRTEAFNDAVGVLSMQIKAVRDNVTTAFLPVLEKMQEKIAEVFMSIKEESGGFDQLGVNIANSVIQGLAAAIKAVGEFQLTIANLAANLDIVLPKITTQFADFALEILKIIPGARGLATVLEIDVIKAQANLKAQTDKVIESNTKFRDKTIEVADNLLGLQISLDDVTTSYGNVKKSAEEVNDVLDRTNPINAYIDSIKDLSKALDTLAVNAMKKFEDAIIDGLRQGKLSFKDFADYVVEQLLRIAIQQLIIQQILNPFRDFLGGITGQNKTPTPSTLNPTAGGNPNYLYEGGGYTGMGVRAGGVDGRGGFPAILHPNETVIDHTKGQGMGATVNFNINTVDATGFDELLATRKNMIISMVNQAYNSRGKMGIA